MMQTTEKIVLSYKRCAPQAHRLCSARPSAWQNTLTKRCMAEYGWILSPGKSTGLLQALLMLRGQDWETKRVGQSAPEDTPPNHICAFAGRLHGRAVSLRAHIWASWRHLQGDEVESKKEVLRLLPSRAACSRGWCVIGQRGGKAGPFWPFGSSGHLPPLPCAPRPQACPGRGWEHCSWTLVASLPCHYGQGGVCVSLSIREGRCSNRGVEGEANLE